MRVSIWPGLLGVLSCVETASGARAADGRLHFDLPSRSPAETALALGLNAGVSVGLGVSCHGPPVRLAGRFDVHAAFDEALASSDCQAVWVDWQTVRIERRRTPPPPPERPRPRPAVEPPPSDVSEVVVTASKRGLNAFDLPGSVTVVRASDLAAARSRDTSDLRLFASGMTVTNLGPGRDKVLLRGLSDGAFTGHTQSTVGIYWNQTPTTYNAPDPDLRLVDVKSVEVLRGPQGTLYGAGAIGGVVSVTPNAPDPSRASGSLSASAAMTEGGAPSGGGEAVLNTPLAGGRAAARVVAYGETEGGYIDLPRLGVQDANTARETGVRAALLFKAAPSWNVTVGNIYQDISSRDTQYVTSASDALTRATQVREPHDNAFEQAYLDVRGAGTWGELRSIGSFIHHEFDSRYDASLGLARFGSAPAPAALDDDTLIRLTSEELDYRAPVHGPWSSLLVGAYGGYGDEHELTNLQPIGGGSIYAEDRTDRLIDLALFGEAGYAVTPRLTLTLGTRFAYAERRTSSRRVQGVGVASFRGLASTRQLSPKVALDYALTADVHAYALISKGYRVGGFNTAGPNDTAFTGRGGAQPNRAYLPDDLWNYEAGLKVRGWGGRLEARTAVYYDVWRRLQADQFLSSGLPYVANVGVAHIGGWEGEASVRPIPAFTVAVGALVTNPDLHRADPTFAAGRSEFTLPGVPRQSINGRIGYEIALGPARTLEFDATALYVGNSYLFFGPQGEAVMGRYLDARLQAVLRTPAYVLSLLVSNPADSRGDTFAFGNPFSLGVQPQETPLRPRTLRLTLTRAF